ncbi:hypothetical protein G4B88_019450 [Cannabis sativa]|uniref:Uncharacterized protein n=1 Tax=Cannabis sativa TaxID=3483 RepID=A0A7J6HZK5_CANSA|nr:hypothetical protein G4B88_019450 [Cannabis sativa]
MQTETLCGVKEIAPGSFKIPVIVKHQTNHPLRKFGFDTVPKLRIICFVVGEKKSVTEEDDGGNAGERVLPEKSEGDGEEGSGLRISNFSGLIGSEKDSEVKRKLITNKRAKKKHEEMPKVLRKMRVREKKTERKCRKKLSSKTGAEIALYRVKNCYNHLHHMGK